MRQRWFPAAVGWAMCVALVAASGCAGLATADKSRARGDRPRVVVLDVEGKRSAAVRNKIVALLRDRYQVVPRNKYERAAKRLRASSLRATDVAEVAAELELDAVVHGYLEPDGKRRYQLAVLVREGESGAVIEELGVPLRTRRLAGKARRRLRKRLHATVAGIASQREVRPRESRLDALAEVNEREGQEHRERRAAERERQKEERAERRRGRREDRARRAEQAEERERALAERERAAEERAAEERERAAEARAAEERERAARRGEREARRRASDERAERERSARAERDVDDGPDEDAEPPPRVKIRRDDSGQAIDDEMPDVLR